MIQINRQRDTHVQIKFTYPNKFGLSTQATRLCASRILRAYQRAYPESSDLQAVLRMSLSHGIYGVRSRHLHAGRQGSLATCSADSRRLDLFFARGTLQTSSDFNHSVGKRRASITIHWGWNARGIGKLRSCQID